jgi:hypothetical protein
MSLLITPSVNRELGMPISRRNQRVITLVPASVFLGKFVLQPKMAVDIHEDLARFGYQINMKL